MPTFPTPDPISATLDLPVADVVISASDRADTVVDVRPRDPGRAADVTAAEQVRVERADGRLLVKSPKSWRRYRPYREAGAIDVRLDLPTGSRIVGDSAMGTFRTEGELGDCRLKAGMGDVRIDHVGALELRTGYGDVTVDRALADVEVTTGSGEVLIHHAGGGAVIKNSNGGTRVGDVRGDLRVKAANGDIAIERALGSVTAKTANGDVRIGEVTRGAIEVGTSIGELDVGIREGTAAWLDVSSGFGRVHQSLDPSDAPVASEETVRVHARTAHGDIRIHRAEERPAPRGA
jgi:hypothetical protein